MRSPPTAPGITRLKTLPMKPSSIVDRSVNCGSITRTSKYQRTKVIEQADQEDHERQREQAEVEGPGEDLADLVAVLPEHDAEQARTPARPARR